MLARQPPVGGRDGYVVCRKHHPDKSPTADQVLAAHAEHKRAAAEARATGFAAVDDVREAAHEVAADVHRVAGDVTAEASADR